MTTLLYHWNFTGDNTLSLNEAIYDSESNLVAKVKRRGTYSSSNFSRSTDGILLDNNDSTNGGYYIELDGLNNVKWGGNISIEMVLQNNELTVSGSNKKSLYFSSTTEEGELTLNGASLVARFGGGKTKFLARPDSTNNVSYGNANPPYRNVNESSNTVVTEGTEHHYIFSVKYDSSTGSSLKIYIDGDKKGENTVDLEKELIDDIRGSNIIGTNKDDSNTTYLKGIVKYVKIYQNSMTDSEATSLYSTFSNSPYLSNISNVTNGVKYTRRHTDVESYFSNNSHLTSFSITGNQLGLSNGSENYKVIKFTHGSTFTITDNYNYIPITGENKFAILKYDSKYFRITQTSSVSDENSKYKCELSEGNTDNFSEVCSNKGFGDNYTDGNITILFGGAEFNINNEICFHEDTILNTDQGEVKIKDIKSFHTIEGYEIIYLIKSQIKHSKLVLIKKNALGNELPNRDTILTRNHIIFYNNKMVKACSIIDNINVLCIDNKNSDVYNIIILNKKFINVNNLLMDVLGIDDLYLKKLKEKYEKGEKFHSASFSSNTIINLELCKIKNF